ncbi:MAG: hypothetical protein ACUVRM_10445 [Bacillota bacterium]
MQSSGDVFLPVIHEERSRGSCNPEKTTQAGNALPQGYRPVPGCPPELIGRNPRFRAADLPDYEIREFEPLLDSANMTPEDWVRIARAIQAHFSPSRPAPVTATKSMSLVRG